MPLTLLNGTERRKGAIDAKCNSDGNANTYRNSDSHTYAYLHTNSDAPADAYTTATSDTRAASQSDTSHLSAGSDKW